MNEQEQPDLRSTAERDQAVAMENRRAMREAMNSQAEQQQQGQEAEPEQAPTLTAEDVINRLRAAEKASAAVGAELEQLRSAQRRIDRELLLVGIMLALIAYKLRGLLDGSGDAARPE